MSAPIQDPAELRRNAELLAALAQHLNDHASLIDSTQPTQTTLESVKAIQTDLAQRIAALEDVVRKAQGVIDLMNQVDHLNSELIELKNTFGVAQQDIDSLPQPIEPALPIPEPIPDAYISQGRAKRTVVAQCYNEEFLLPWWLKHHKHVYDHGIIVDYASTDRTRDIIREICPTWEIVPSRNEHFNGNAVDEEIMDIERGLDGWRMAMNITEMLYGNLDHLTNTTNPTQYMITNYVFVDMEDPAKCPELTYDRPLHEQRYWGFHDYDTNRDPGIAYGPGKGEWSRLNRSLHNHPVQYTGGRHYPRTDYTFDDLVLFYYGWADIGERGLARKTQIRARIHDGMTGIHTHERDEYINMYRHHQQPVSTDLRPQIASILAHHHRCTGQEW